MDVESKSLVSVIIPVYNSESSIERCVRSIIDQTYKKTEILVVNDGSTDNSIEVCKKLKRADSRIKIINKGNGGVSNARNTGIKNARGEFVIFLDSDDFVEPMYVEHLLDTSVELVIEGINKVENGHGKTYLPEKTGVYEANARLICEALDRSDLNYCYGKLYKRELINKYGIFFHEDISFAEDTVFVCEYIRHVKKVRFIKRADYNYVQHDEGTLSTSFRPEDINILERANALIEEALKQVTNGGICSVVDKRMFGMCSFYFLKVLENKSFSKNKKKEYYKELICNPHFKMMITEKYYFFPNNSWKFYMILMSKNPFIYSLFL